MAQEALIRLPDSFQRHVDANRSLQKMVLRIIRQGGSVETAQAYVYDVVEFAKALGGIPDQMLATGFDWAAVMNEHLDRLIVENGFSPASAQRRVSGVKRWLTVNDVTVNWSKVETPKKQVVESDQLPTKAELRTAYSAADLSDRVLMLVLVSTGLRVGSVPKIQLKHVDLTREVPVVKVPKEITKGRKSFVAFLTPEAKQTIAAYLKQRELRGEKLTPESYLLACERPRGKIISKRSLTWRWKTLLKRIGLDEKGTRFNARGEKVRAKRNLRHIHVLRKFYKTWASLSGMNAEVVEYTMGHRSGVKAAYFIPDDADQIMPDVLAKLETEYRKAIPALEVMNEGEKIQKLEEKLQDQAENYEKKLKALEEKEDTLAKMEERLADVTRQMERQQRQIREMAMKLAGRGGSTRQKEPETPTSEGEKP